MSLRTHGTLDKSTKHASIFSSIAKGSWPKAVLGTVISLLHGGCGGDDNDDDDDDDKVEDDYDVNHTLL